MRRLFAEHPGEVACLVLEPATAVEPAPGFLEGLRELCTAEGALLVFDEMITGFRWDVAGAQRVYGVRPDLTTFGKAMGNGFAIAALAGPRELMELGGIRDPRERVFLLSTTHGAETIALAAMVAVLRDVRARGSSSASTTAGGAWRPACARPIRRRRARGPGARHGAAVQPRVRDPRRRRPASQPFRTLFLQELIARGVIGPSFVVSAALSDEDIDRTVEAVDAALGVYGRALEDGVDRHLRGRPVKPVFRPYA